MKDSSRLSARSIASSSLQSSPMSRIEEHHYRRGLDVVGYTGFVPGKNTGNVFGKTFAHANHAAQKLEASHKPRLPYAHSAFVEKTLKMFEKQSPSSTHGNYNMYSTLSTRTSSSRSSSCMA